MPARVQSHPFDFASEMAAFRAASNGAGALVSFTGIVRDLPQGGLKTMEIEHYPAMTQKALEQFANQAITRFDLINALVIHRYGALTPDEDIMMVATAATHRKDAFAAADYLMDYLKSRAPFWKKEITDQGADWVAAKGADEDALTQWGGS